MHQAIGTGLSGERMRHLVNDGAVRPLELESAHSSDAQPTKWNIESHEQTQSFFNHNN